MYVDDRYDYDALRDRLMDECGAAGASGMWPALADLFEAESASDDELLSIANRLGVDVRE